MDKSLLGQILMECTLENITKKSATYLFPIIYDALCQDKIGTCPGDAFIEANSEFQLCKT